MWRGGGLHDPSSMRGALQFAMPENEEPGEEVESPAGLKHEAAKPRTECHLGVMRRFRKGDHGGDQAGRENFVGARNWLATLLRIGPSASEAFLAAIQSGSETKAFQRVSRSAIESQRIM